MDNDRYYMQLALEQARKAYALGEVPIGAVIVKDGEVVASACNTTETDRDPTCHAEISAIRLAAKKLGGWRLPGCSMYVTLEPCSMCAGAIVLARIEKLFIGALDPKAGACVSLSSIVTDPRLNHRVELQTGVLGEECSAILKDFFRELRASRKSVSPEDI